MTTKIETIIVVYNKRIQDTITYKCLKKIDNANIKITVVDNSDVQNGNESYSRESGIHYISMEGNKGLSKAYNAAIDNCKYDVIILLDDDTEITEEYFSVLDTALMEHPDVGVFAPIVYGQDGVIYSPNEFHFLRNHFITSADQNVAQDKFNAIASCLAVRREIFNDYRFNEILFVDQVDHNFFCEQRTKGTKFMKLNVEIHQNFHQRGDSLSAEAGWNRLRLRIVDVMRHARLMGGLKYILLGLVKCCGLGLQIGKKSKSFSVVYKAIKLSIKAAIHQV